MKKLILILPILFLTCDDDLVSPYDECGVLNGDNSSCTDECGVVNGDNSSCTDACGVVNGDNSACLGCDGIPNSGLIVEFVDEFCQCDGVLLDNYVELWGACYNIE